MSRPATRDPEATRAAIVKAAFQLFVEKGYADTAVSEIARSAGVTQSLIHHHFGSKQELWSQVGESCLSELSRSQGEQLRKAREQPGIEGLQMLVRELFTFARQRPELMRLYLWVGLERAHIPTPDRAHLQRAEEIYAHIGELQRANVIRSDIRPEYVLTMIEGMLIHWMQVRQDMTCWIHHREMDPSRVGPEELAKADEEYLEAALKTFVEGVAARR